MASVYVNFGTKAEKGFELVESDDLIAVRTRTGRSVRGLGPVPAPATVEVADGSLVAEFKDAGVEVFRVPPSRRSVAERKQALRSTPDVRFAGSVLVDPSTQEPVIYTENLYVQFREDVPDDKCEDILRDFGLTVKEALDIATNSYFAEAPEGTGQRVFEIAARLLELPEVLYSHPEIVRERRRRQTQIYPQQWHLHTTQVMGNLVDAHANVAAAHVLTKGAGVTIAVIDDGVDIDHAEFAAPGKIVFPRDVTLDSNDPRPKFADDMHGTACAGVATAGGHTGASGVAPESRLMPIRLASGLGSVQEARAFKWAADNGADVISCSWGPVDGRWWDPTDPRHSTVVALPASTRVAIDHAITNGRSGKGCVILFAAGNGNEPVENDGYASYSRVIAVAASNDRSRRSGYSDFGPAIWCSFPSSDFGHAPTGRPVPLTPGIWTTDRRGFSGYNDGNLSDGDAAGHFTNSFGGTSSACPGAAGVAALALSVNQGLSADQVRDILKRACDRIDQAGGNYDASGHSRMYGYGRLNAETAVKLAKIINGRLIIVNKLVNSPIPDLGSVSDTIDMTETALAQRLVVTVRLTHTYIGDLVITLIPPTGSGLPSTVLHNRAGGSRRNLDTQFDPSNTPGLAAYTNKKCTGTWTIKVEDKAAQDAGTLVQIGLQLSVP